MGESGFTKRGSGPRGITLPADRSSKSAECNVNCSHDTGGAGLQTRRPPVPSCFEKNGAQKLLSDLVLVLLLLSGGGEM